MRILLDFSSFDLFKNKILILLAFFFIVFPKNSDAQEKEGSTGDEVLYRNEMQGGAFVHNFGLGLFFRKGVHKTGKRKQFFELDLLSMKHPKEYKSDSPFDNGSYIYGKINSLNIFRTGFGYHNTLSGKDKRKGVEVRYHYYFGSSLGILKPVYLEIIHNDHHSKHIVSERHNPINHHVENIYGKSPFTKGFNEIKIEPGIYGKFGLSFEYSAFDDVVRALETGVVVDAYRKKVPIMGSSINSQYFISFYIGVVFGKKEF